jgi:hypothetical protein
MQKRYAITDSVPEVYDFTDDAAQEVPPGYRVIDAVQAERLGSKYNPLLREPEAMRLRIAEVRFQKETQGIVVGDQVVSTNRDEVHLWLGMLLDITLRPGVTASFEYKPRNGINTTLTPLQVQRCYDCFAWYVQACFATERALIELLDSGTSLSVLHAMLEEAWPQTHFAAIAE